MKKLLLLFTLLKTLHGGEICIKTRCSVKNNQYKCRNANLTFIPITAIEAELVDLSGNNLPTIEPSDFADFNHLTELILSNVSLRLVHRNAFRKLKFLEKLDLSMNLLKSLSPDTFQDTIIQHLNLSGNIFRRLANNQFLMPHLIHLDLSNGFLQNIPNSAFVNSTSLRWLNLSSNKLTKLVVSEMIISCPRLKYLILNDNPWQCDCEFCLMFKTPVIYQNSVDLRCEYDDEDLYFGNISIYENVKCQEYANKTFEEIVSRNIDKSTDNAPNLILNVYGYVMIGISILIIFCCCCKGKTAPSDRNDEVQVAPVIEKYYKNETGVEQIHTFEKCKVEFHQDNNDVNISVDGKKFVIE